MKNLMTTWARNTDFLAALIQHQVRFLIVGGVAVKFYADEREADDLDLLMESTEENVKRLALVLNEFPMVGNVFSLDNAMSETPQHLPLKSDVYIDILTTGNEINFSLEWDNAVDGLIWQHPVKFASKELLISMKCKGDREKDRADVVLLSR
jgi:hypothetical protein